MDFKDRLKAFRNALELTQDELADAGGLLRTEMNKLERGHNKGTTMNIRQKLAIAFGLELVDANAYLDGQITLADALRRRRKEGRRTASGTMPAVDDDPANLPKKKPPPKA